MGSYILDMLHMRSASATSASSSSNAHKEFLKLHAKSGHAGGKNKKHHGKHHQHHGKHHHQHVHQEQPVEEWDVEPSRKEEFAGSEVMEERNPSSTRR